MFDLTPLDVRKKRDDFKRTLRGYDPAQVDAFLEVVSDRLEQLVREHGTLSDQVGHMQSQLETYQERERALNEALLAAQELREEARSQSERDAAIRLREAETHAEAILLDADQAIRHSQRRLEDLRARRRQFLKSLRSVMERFEDYLELEDARLETEPEDLGDLLERLDHDLVPEETSTDVPEPLDMQKAASYSEVVAEPPDSGEVGPVASHGEGDGAAPAAAIEGSGVMAPTSHDGRTEEVPSRVMDAIEEVPGSRFATPTPITPPDSGDPGATTA